ncbi:hypothetical protein VRRI112168_07295 [Vreelandella rituensis]|uniref:Uncharacterized protein n=1 Tax=Vreelandella rituensis TaxID=2282306 RepID=A0A368U4Y2_9GAMM|nr:hypothetical protein [Halomonas rituensis]RCV92178.1 hypothetical protein DU506_09265 [Halomonas rituensis]
MNIDIQPLPGHPYTINARLVTRSPQELLGISPKKNKGSSNVHLMHPPVLLVQDGGGEVLLNRETVLAQLNLNKKKSKKGTKIPESLVACLIEEANVSGEMRMLMGCLFGPLQRLYHEKKDASGNLNWREAIDTIKENPPLKFCIEKTLFNGEELSTRHYVLLLRGANLSASSIARKSGAKKTKRDNKKSKKSNTNNSKKTFNEKNEVQLLKCEKPISPPNDSSEVLKRKENKAGLNRPLKNIKKTAERAENQLSLIVEFDE